MLSVNSYTKEYVEDCRAKIAAQVAAYEEVAKLARKAGGSSKAAIDSFEPVYFNGLVILLDAYFIHRARGMEGKDGNPLNEVRMLGNSLMLNDGVLAADKSIKLGADSSVLGYEVGDEIALSEQDFVALADAFFAEIERKYP